MILNSILERTKFPTTPAPKKRGRGREIRGETDQKENVKIVERKRKEEKRNLKNEFPEMKTGDRGGGGSF